MSPGVPERRMTADLPVAALEVERVRDPDAFRDLRNEWDELLQDSASDSLFLTWEWLHTWWKHLAGPRKLFILTVRSGGRLVAIAPLALRTRWAAGVVPVRALEFLGSDRLSSDYLDVIVRRGWQEQAVLALAEYLVRRPFLLEMANVDKAGRVASSLAVALAQQGWSLSEAKVDVCPFINLSGHTWESYLGIVDSKDRSDFGRSLRNLNKRFAVRFEEARSEEQRPHFLALLVALHNQRRQDRGGSDAFHTADLLSFHEELSRLTLDRGWLRLFVLSLDGRPAASLYGFRYHRTFYFLQTGFDPDYARQRVGLITVGLTVRSAIAEGAEEYDFLRGAEPYKFRWAQEVRELTTLTVCPGRARELLYRRAQALTVAAKRTVRWMLPGPVLERIAAYRQLRLSSRLGAGRP